jgi:hypothetical protein
MLLWTLVSRVGIQLHEVLLKGFATYVCQYGDRHNTGLKLSNKEFSDYTLILQQRGMNNRLKLTENSYWRILQWSVTEIGILEQL